jgi:hypothetical protein
MIAFECVKEPQNRQERIIGNSTDHDIGQTSFIVRAREYLTLLISAGVIFYGALTVMYSRFYGPLGVSPEEVGRTYADILSRSIGSVLFLAAMLTLVMVAISMTLERPVETDARSLEKLSSKRLTVIASPVMPNWVKTQADFSRL